MNIRTSFFQKFAIAIFGVFILNSLATFFFWYEGFVWFDMVMHFFGGIVVTFFLAWLLYHLYRTWREKGAVWRIIILNSGLFILVAILWEIMEFSVQHAFDIYGVLATPADSVSDIICGLVGSLVALLYYFMKVKRHG